MTYNLEIDYHGNGKINEVFHPTLPFSVLYEEIFLGDSTGMPNEWTFTTKTKAVRPFFLLSVRNGGQNYGIPFVTTGTRDANGYLSVKIYIRRRITLIHPQTGHIYWHGEGKELVKNLYLMVGEIRG